MKLCICGVKLPPHHSKYCSKQCFHKAKYLRHKDKILSISRQWDKDNPERRKAISKRYREKHPAMTTYYRRHKRLVSPLEVLSYL